MSWKFIAKRQTDTIVARKARTITFKDGIDRHVPEERRPVSNAEINREMQILKRAFRPPLRRGLAVDVGASRHPVRS
jgi:hypothetical protein